MSQREPARTGVRAGVPSIARAIIAERAPAAEVLAIDELDELDGFDFLVPVPRRSRELAAKVGKLSRLAVIQTLSAGVDALEGAIPDQVTLCSARGARDDAVAEWVLGALLGSLSGVVERHGAGSWQPQRALQDLAESRVLIVGMGSIGGRVGELLRAFRAEPVGVASRARDGLHGVDELPALLPAADAVVLLAPLTEATEQLMNAQTLALMRDGALLVNAGRGGLVDTDALLAELDPGRLCAVLDVTDPEPLPDGHPLWEAAGTLSITPHLAGNSPRANRLAAELVGDQLARFCAGATLENIVQDGRKPA